MTASGLHSMSWPPTPALRTLGVLVAAFSNKFVSPHFVLYFVLFAFLCLLAWVVLKDLCSLKSLGAKGLI